MSISDRIVVGAGVLFVVVGLLSIYHISEQEKKCNDAGGVVVTPTVCINPAAIIEVN